MDTATDSTLKIIYADDDSDDREYFSEIVEKTGGKSEIKLLKDGDELMEHLSNEENESPHLIFIDINMPKMNGRDCVKEIRNNIAWNNTPLVIISTSSYQLDINETFAYGANLFISKNMFVDAPHETMSKVFNLYRKGELMNHDEKKYYWTPEGF